MKNKMKEMDMEEMHDDMEMEDEGESEMSDMEVECKARTLLEAEKIKKDEKLMEKINKYFDDQKKQISSIQDLKDLRNKAFKKKNR